MDIFAIGRICENNEISFCDWNNNTSYRRRKDHWSWKRTDLDHYFYIWICELIDGCVIMFCMNRIEENSD